MSDPILFKWYGPLTPTVTETNLHRPTTFIYSEQWFDQWPGQLIASGMTCDEAKLYIAENWNKIFWTDPDGNPQEGIRVIARADTFVDLCDAVEWNGGTGGTFYIRVTETSPAISIGGINSEFVCTPSPTKEVDGTWSLLIFEGFVNTDTRWLPVVEAITALDIDKWFCNSSNCCGGGNTINGGGQFLIPAVNLPEPVAQEATTPILGSALYLANHTFQFVRNFGRVK